MLNKNVWIKTMQVLHPLLEGLDQLFAERQSDIDDTLRKKVDALRQRRRRASGDNAESTKWKVKFDLERISKGSGLIEVDEIAPFVDCKDIAEYLITTRRFAYAFRTEDRDCADIQPAESINDFILRVQKLWYSAPLGTVFHFIRLDNYEFDDDAGFKRDEPVDWDVWTPIPGSERALTADEITALPMAGKPEPEWRKAGFDCYSDYAEHIDKEECKKKDRAQLEASLRTKEQIDQDLKSGTGESKTPQLLYQGIITEH